MKHDEVWLLRTLTCGFQKITLLILLSRILWRQVWWAAILAGSTRTEPPCAAVLAGAGPRHRFRWLNSGCSRVNGVFRTPNVTRPDPRSRRARNGVEPHPRVRKSVGLRWRTLAVDTDPVLDLGMIGGDYQGCQNSSLWCL